MKKNKLKKELKRVNKVNEVLSQNNAELMNALIDLQNEIDFLKSNNKSLAESAFGYCNENLLLAIENNANKLLFGDSVGTKDFLNSLIEKVIFQGNTTIVYWKNGEKTMVRAQEGEFTEPAGIAICLCKYLFGNSSSAMNNSLKALVENAERPRTRKERKEYARLKALENENQNEGEEKQEAEDGPTDLLD